MTPVVCPARQAFCPGAAERLLLADRMPEVHGVPGGLRRRRGGVAAGGHGHHAFTFSVELDESGTSAAVAIEIGGDTLRQRLAMPASEEWMLVVELLAAARHDPVFVRALGGAVPLLEALR